MTQKNYDELGLRYCSDCKKDVETKKGMNWIYCIECNERLN